MVARKPAARAAKARIDFVCDQEHVLFATKFGEAFQKTGLWNALATSSLNRFDQHGTYGKRTLLNRPRCRAEIAVWRELCSLGETRCEWVAEVFAPSRVEGSECQTVIRALEGENPRLARCQERGFDCSFNGVRARRTQDSACGASAWIVGDQGLEQLHLDRGRMYVSHAVQKSL